MNRLIFIFLLLTCHTIFGQRSYVKEKFKSHKALSTAIDNPTEKYTVIETSSSDGTKEWITIHPETKDTLLYKGQKNGFPIGRWKSLKKRRMYHKTYKHYYLSDYLFDIYERKFDLLKYDTVQIEKLEVPDKKPLFSHQNSFASFLGRNLNYPLHLRDKGIHGTVFAKLNLDKEGNLSFISIVKSVHPHLDVEVIHVIEKCPKWESPAYKNGKAVAYIFVYPISWQLR